MYSYKKINSYFDKKSENIPFDIQKEYHYVFSKDNNGKNIIELLDPKTDKLILKAEYSIMGMYNTYNSVWYWGYNLSFVNHQAAKKSKVLLDVPKEIKKEYKQYKDKEADEIHYMSSNGNFFLDVQNIPKVVQLGLFAMEGEWFIEIKYDSNDDVVHGKVDDKKSPVKKIEYYCINKVILKG